MVWMNCNTKICITMNAMQLYVSASRYIVHANYREPREWEDLYRFLPYLRQSLSCCVCYNVLNIPMGPVESICVHHVCKECVGGKMRLKPSCSWCKDYESFHENELLRLVVKCFKKLCEYIAGSPAIQRLATTTVNGGTNNLLNIIQEGLAIRDGGTTGTVNISLPSLLPLAPPINSNTNEPMRQISSDSNSTCTPPVISAEQITSVMHDYAKPSEAENGIAGNPPQCINTASSPFQTKKSTKSKNKSSRKRKLSESGPSKKKAKSNKSKESIMGVAQQASVSVPALIQTLQNTGTAPIKEKSFVSLQSEPQSSNSNNNYSEQAQTQTPKKKKTSKKRKLEKEKKGCRCGNATPNPGKLTCYGQRCPCYSNRLACSECCCRGCRNPYRIVKIEPVTTVSPAEVDEDVEITVV